MLMVVVRLFQRPGDGQVAEADPEHTHGLPHDGECIAVYRDLFIRGSNCLECIALIPP